jgi:glutamyl-tRNA reductase
MTGRGVISGASVAHEDATVADLERAAFDSPAAALDRLTSVPAVREAYVLQTCNRVEAYVVTEDAPDGRAALDAFFADVPDDVCVELGHEESLRHLMRVAAGLESLVVGEGQILGQVGDAFDTAQEAGALGPVLEQGVTKAIRVGERARTETAINEGSVSLASTAVTLAEDEGVLPGEEALIVGAGEMGRLAAKALAGRVDHLHVVNRTRDRAEHVASLVEVDTTVRTLDELTAAVESAPVVVTATDSPETLIDAEALEPAGDTFVIDLARPRDVAPDADDLTSVTVNDMDTLRSVTDENRRQRAEAAAAVEEMIDVEFEHLLEQYKRKRADRVISAMYESAERVKARELDTAFETAEFDEDQREVIESMADAMVNQLLAAPTRSLRDAAEQDDWSTINTALQLFDPDFGPDSVPPAAVARGDVSPEDIPESVRERMPQGVFEELDD